LAIRAARHDFKSRVSRVTEVSGHTKPWNERQCFGDLHIAHTSQIWCENRDACRVMPFGD